MKNLIDSIEDLLIEFNEMGFVPTNHLHDHDPEACAIDWKNRLVEALEGYIKQIDTPTLMPTQTDSGICELEKIYEMALDLCVSRGVAYVDDCRKCCVHEGCLYQSMARGLYKAGYRKQSEGMWEIVIGSNGKEKMVCTNCRHQQDLASTFTYCPNCGAKMKGADDGKAD